MAYFILPKPGEINPHTKDEIGPCVDEACGHKDCAATRKQAVAPCPICNKTIGYGSAVVFHKSGSDALAHWRCVYKDV